VTSKAQAVVLVSVFTPLGPHAGKLIYIGFFSTTHIGLIHVGFGLWIAYADFSAKVLYSAHMSHAMSVGQVYIK
jgi:hypothetical protein